MTTEWLNDEEQTAWRRLIAVVMLLPNQLDANMREHEGLNMHEYWVLAMLSEAPERSMRMRELARRSTASASRLSHTITRLQERGLVTRERPAMDLRGQTARLTDAGWELVVTTAPAHVADVRRLVFDPLTREQVVQLSGACDRILTQLDPTGERSPGGRF